PRHHDVIGHRLGEVRTELDPPLDRLDDLGVGVADDHDAETVVEVDVLVAVYVPDAAALAALDEDRLGGGVLGGGPAAPREDLACLGPQLVRTRPGLAELVLLGLDQLRHAAGGYLASLGRRHVVMPSGGKAALTGQDGEHLIVPIFCHPSVGPNWGGGADGGNSRRSGAKCGEAKA